jgi:hypothetical protein
VWSDSNEGYGVHFDCESSQTARLERVARRMRAQLQERLETIIANQAVSEDDKQWLKAGLKRANAFYKFANKKHTSARHDENLLDLFSLAGKYIVAINFVSWNNSQVYPMLQWMILNLDEYIPMSGKLQLEN